MDEHEYVGSLAIPTLLSSPQQRLKSPKESIQQLTMVYIARHDNESATSSFTPRNSRTRTKMSSGREVGSMMFVI